MTKVRVNFNLPENLYQMVKDIADEEGSSSADIFRRAVKKYVQDHKNEGLGKFNVQSIASKEVAANE